MIDQSKLTEVNFDNTLTEMSLKIKHFLHVEILSNVIKQQSDTFIKKFKRFLCVKISKRRQKNNNSDLNESITKIFRIMFTFMTLTASNKTSYTVSLRSNIFTLTTYVKAVKDSI